MLCGTYWTGNFLTQALSTILTTGGVCLLAFSTWQYTVFAPTCCYTSNASITEQFTGENIHAGSVIENSVLNWSSNCSELHKVSILEQVNLHIPPTVNMILAITGLIVSVVMLHGAEYMQRMCY